jgi:hypothetical protein
MLCSAVLSAWLALPEKICAQDALQELQRKSDLNPEDTSRIDAWLKERVADLERDLATDNNSARAQSAFTSEISQLQSGGSSSFRRVFAERASALFADEIRSTNGTLSHALMAGLRALGHPAALSGYLRALDAPDPAVRLMAVRGIRSLASAAGTGDAIPVDQLPATLQRLGETGQRETNDLVLQYIYAAFSFSQARDEQAKAVLQILEARLERLKAGKPLAEAADAQAYARLQELFSSLPEAEQTRLVRVLAAFLAVYCHRLVHADAAHPPDELIRLTVLNEKLLSRITSVNGGVAAALATPEAQREQKTLEAARHWFGSASTPGALSGGRWQVPPGGGVAGVSFDD